MSFVDQQYGSETLLMLLLQESVQRKKQISLSGFCDFNSQVKCYIGQEIGNGQSRTNNRSEGNSSIFPRFAQTARHQRLPSSCFARQNDKSLAPRDSMVNRGQSLIASFRCESKGRIR